MLRRAPEVRAQMPTRPRAAGALRAVGPMQREALVLGRWAEAPRRQVALARRLLRLQAELLLLCFFSYIFGVLQGVELCGQRAGATYQAPVSACSVR